MMKYLFFAIAIITFAACNTQNDDLITEETNDENTFRTMYDCGCPDGEIPYLKIKNQQKFYLPSGGDTVGSLPDMLKAIDIHNYDHVELAIYGLKDDGETPNKRKMILYTDNVFNSCIDLNEIGALYYHNDELPVQVYWRWKDSYGHEFTLIDSISGHPYEYVPITKR